MRWYSLKGVPRGSKNGSGAIIRMRIWRTANCKLIPDEPPRQIPRPHRTEGDRQPWPALPAVLARRRVTAVGRRAAGVAGLARHGAGALPRHGAVERGAVGCPATRAARATTLWIPDAVLSRGDVLQQLPPQQHRRRRDPDHRHREGRWIENTRHDRRPHRPWHRPAGTRADGRDRRIVDAAHG